MIFLKEVWTWVQIAIAILGGWLGFFLGGMDGLIYALLTFVILDYLSGLACAIADKKLSSEVGFRGICKKILIFCMVAVAHIVDAQLIGAIGNPGGGSAIRTAAIFFYLANEGISLLENTARLGLPVPDKIKDILAQLHGKSDGDNDMSAKG